MSASENDPKIAGLPNRFEHLIRRFFERVGAGIDFALRRGGGLQPRTDLAALASHLERAVEENLKEEPPGVLAPNLFELRYDYETYMRMGASRREYLERELSSNIYEYIYNRRYRTSAETRVRIIYDAFTRGLEVKTGYGETMAAVMPQNASSKEHGKEPGKDQPKAISAPAAAQALVTLRGVDIHWELRAKLRSDGEPAGIGRNVANLLIMKDTTISNFHAALALRADGVLEVADRASANGVYVNGVLLDSGGKCVVRDGDRLRFGEVETILEFSLNR
jgi:hypothetical protein